MYLMSVSRLTLKQLRAIQQVYRTGQISAAAEALNITQSATSVLIRQAETVLGATLFERTTRSLAPSAAGESVIGLVERILGDLSTLEETIRGLRDLERGRIRLTATPATGLTLLPETVRRFRAAYPAVSLILDDCAPDQFYSNIIEQRADFGIGTEPEDKSALDWQILNSDPLCIICAVDHPFAERDCVGWRELKDEPLILSRRDYGVRGMVETTLAKLNSLVREQKIRDRDGALVTEEPKEALMTDDGKIAYPVVDGIPMLLAERGISLSQLDAS